MTLNTEPRTPEEALTLALYLGLTAPDDARAEEAGRLADMLAVGVDTDTIERAKVAALAAWEADDR